MPKPSDRDARPAIPRVAPPSKPPRSISELADSSVRQQLVNVWRNASQLRRLIDHIYSYWQSLPPRIAIAGGREIRNMGTRDLPLELKMQKTFRTLIYILKSYDINIVKFNQKTEDELASMMPDFPPFGWLEKAREELLRTRNKQKRNVRPGKDARAGRPDARFKMLSIQPPNHEQTRARLFELRVLGDDLETFLDLLARDPGLRTAFASEATVRGSAAVGEAEKHAMEFPGAHSPNADKVDLASDRDQLGPRDAPTDRQQPAVDPVEEAAELIAASPQSVRLIRYLYGRTDRKASLSEIAVAMDSASQLSALRRGRTVRQRFNRARDHLERLGARVSLQIDDNVVALVIPATQPTRATST